MSSPPSRRAMTTHTPKPQDPAPEPEADQPFATAEGQSDKKKRQEGGYSDFKIPRSGSGSGTNVPN